MTWRIYKLNLRNSLLLEEYFQSCAILSHQYYSKINLEKQEYEIFCDEPSVHEQIFYGYSEIRRSRAEEFSIHNSQFSIHNYSQAYQLADIAQFIFATTGTTFHDTGMRSCEVVGVDAERTQTCRCRKNISISMQETANMPMLIQEKLLGVKYMYRFSGHSFRNI